jgi:hypothetical protein
MNDPLVGLFLAGLLGALAAWLAMARAAFGSGRLESARMPPTWDIPRDYRNACDVRDQPPLLWYFYCVSLGLGFGALVLAFL